MTDWADRYWTSFDGLRLHARDHAAAAGEARLPVICIHGLTRNARDFEDLAPWIAVKGRRVLSVEMRGRGGSDRDLNPENYQPGVYARDVAGLFHALGIERALFVGTSMGGLITLALAAMTPRLIAGAVLNDIGPKIDSEGMARLRRYVGKPVEVADWHDAAAYAKTVNELAFRTANPALWPRIARRLFVDGPDDRPVLDYDPAISRSLGDANAELPEAWPLFEALAKGRPLAVIRGEVSDLLSRETVGRMRAIAPHATFAEAAGVGHAPLLNEPEALAALETFFSGAP